MIESPRDPIYDELPNLSNPTQHHHEFIGDTIEEDPPSDVTRIYIQNLNGLSWDNDGGKWPYVCEVMSSLQVDVACFSEINTDTNKYIIRHQMEQISQLHLPKSRLVLATSPHKTTRAYKPGGTAILASSSIVSTIKSHTRDRMGRWTSICLSVSSARTIRIISAYQVCDTRTRGTTTAAAQQMAQIITENS